MRSVTRAVLIDALGTLVRLEPPSERLAAALGNVPLAEVERAMRLEMAHYRAHSHEAGDATSLAALRADCARLLSRELGLEVGVETMMSAIRFSAFEDARPALRSLRRRGVRAVCVSNWDAGLPDVLDDTGLAPLLDGVVASAVVGSRKPEPAIFEAGLRLAGCRPEEALVIGDTPAEDLEGARRAGIRAVLVQRGEAPAPSAGRDPVISSLVAISHHLGH